MVGLATASSGRIDVAANVTDAAANTAPDAPAVYTEAGVQTQLDVLKANDDALRTKLNAVLAALRAAGLMV